MNRIHRAPSGVHFKCPGCGMEHYLPVAAPHSTRWEFNEDLQRPTLSPSIAASGYLIAYDDGGNWTGEWVKDAQGNRVPYVCHSFVREGRIEFLGDCTHALAGQTVDLPEVPAE